MPARLWQYASERFPPLRNGLLIAAFAGAGVAIGHLCNHTRGVAQQADGFPFAAAPTSALIITAFVTVFALFLQLRVADEHKDVETDAAHRPERPVPRGLVSLAELTGLSVGAGVIALGLTALLAPRHAVIMLAIVWVWMALMRREFFVSTWLEARPIAYLVSHMLIMPLIAAYGVSVGFATWDAHQILVARPFAVFLTLSLLQGVVLEVARKCWAPESERTGVETYSSRWGSTMAGSVVAASILASGILTAMIVSAFDVGVPAQGAVLAASIGAGGVVLRYVKRPSVSTAKHLELASGLVVLINYSLLAFLPLMLQVRIA